jgi:bifunctional UDP-N-acetylglucosamine pyrophosphorylase / glucosamine-1-phosphate N-acetyltransferase
MKTLGAIILAGGKGRRMQMKTENKVTVALADKPMVEHIVDFMHKININTIIVVVGFAKESVMNVLKKQNVIFAEQKKRLGTGHAVVCALRKLPNHITDVLVVYGDDAVLYAEKNIPIINKLLELHYLKGSSLTFLTIEQENPSGLGRIVRDEQRKLHAIIEEKDATQEQRKIKEINPGCFVFSISFLQKYLPKIHKSQVTGEYYLTSLIDLAIKHKEVTETLQGGKMAWRGVNTREELTQAEQLYNSTHS